jgi:enamine deaminase RidA (YjgF/YER057c/UK114 family)
MPLEHFQTEGGRPLSYSAAVRHGDLIYTAGQLGVASDGPNDFASQAERALQSLIRAVEAAGGGLETIVKITGYLASMTDDFQTYDEIYRRVIAVKPMPARTTIEIGGFPGEILLEVEAVAVVRS